MLRIRLLQSTPILSTNPVAIVTAASRGIDAACARELHSRGYRLALFSSTEAVSALAEELGAVPVVGDIREAKDLTRLVEVCVQRLGRVDAVVNNTGNPPMGSIDEASDDDWLAAWNMCFMNVVRMARLVTPLMKAQGGGAIVNIGSINAIEPGQWYAASARAALTNYVKLYARSHGEHRIRMNNVLPGYLENWELDEDTVATLPLRRAGSLSEVAKTVAFLLSADAGYISGENLKVDGAYTRSA
jgi:NAD(P)-dependent dehydrogenase (short-subunit alcohol dehydrogenase family)